MKQDDRATELLGHVKATDGTGATCRLDAKVLRSARLSGEDGAASHSIGAIVRISVAGHSVFASLIRLEGDDSGANGIDAEVEYIGEGVPGSDGKIAAFRRGVSTYPLPGDGVHLACDAELRAIFAPPDVPHILLGTVYPTTQVRAPVLFDSLMSRHFAVVGSSGAGKSTAVRLMLDRIIEQAPNCHVVILDPHGEYSQAFGESAQVWDVGNLRMPYWALNLEEHGEVFLSGAQDERTVESNILAKCLLKARSRNIHIADHGRITADTPVAYQLADLTDALEFEAGRLEKLADAHRYTHLRLTIEQFFADRRYGFLFNAEHATASLEQLLGDLLRIPSHGKPVSIVDLAGVPTEIVNVVVSTLARLILDYAIWSPRESRAPVLLVCEEAHRYLPRISTPATRSVERQLERIAREGRKYGVSLALVSQRPSELSETALSQCGTILAMRLNNQNDQANLAAALTEGARGMAGSVATLRNRECIISGDGVPVPMRVLIDTLEASKRPASDDPVFSASWAGDSAGAALLSETVRRWRTVR